MNDLVKLLNENGYHTVEGAEAVKNAIKSISDGNNEKLCSGYGVLPGGDKCLGCSDCRVGDVVDN